MTKFHYAGTYNGDPETLICHEHEEGHVAFKEAETMGKLSVIASAISIAIFVVTMGIYFMVGGQPFSMLGMFLSILTLVPHEFLHGICFPGDVYMYSNIKQGMLFVVGPGTFSKWGFVFMSLLPNIVFGLIPFVIFLIDPSQTVLGTMGAFCLSYGAGDYYNVFNAITQMPEGSRTYLHGSRSYWYMPTN